MKRGNMDPMTEGLLDAVASYLEAVGAEYGLEEDLLLAARIRLRRLTPEDEDDVRILVALQLEDFETERLQVAN